MDYIEEMYRQMMASQGRMPASGPDMKVYSQRDVQPGWVKNPSVVPELSDAEVLSKPLNQAHTLPAKAPVADLDRQPIEYPKGYKVQVPESEIIRQNVNAALEDQIVRSEGLQQKSQEVGSEREGYKRDMIDVLNRMKSMTDKTYESPEVDAQISMYQKKMMEPKDSVAPRDPISELILTIGPALGGLLGGESGALSAPAAGKASRDIYEYQRKEEIDRVKALKDDTEKKLKAMIDLKKSGQESFDKSQERGLNRVKAELEATKSLATMSNDDLKRTEDNLAKLNDSITKEIGDKSVDIAKMNRSKWESEQKTKRAPKLMKPPELPLDKKKMVEKYSGEVARITGINSQVSELKRQIGDKNIPELDRLATAQEQLKLLNSTLGSDAVGAEETKRMAAYLDPLPNWVKREVGVDLDGFYRQLDRVNERLSRTISTQQREIDKIYGRPLAALPKQDQPRDSLIAGKPQVVEKVIQGKKRKFKLNSSGKYIEVK